MINYPERVAAIEMHVSFSSHLYCEEAESRIYYYPPPYLHDTTWVYAVPWLWYDGNKHSNHYQTWESKIVVRMKQPAIVTVTMWGTYSCSTDNGIIYVRFRNDSSATVNGKAYFVITEDSIYYPSPNGDVWHNHVARDYLPDHNGVGISIPSGDCVIISQPFMIQQNWDVDQCAIVTWIQDTVMQTDSTIEVWQSGMKKVSKLGIDGDGPTIDWWDSLPDDSSSIPGDTVFGPYPVHSSFFDPSGIHSVWLYWNTDSVEMISVHADTFMAEIPEQIVVFEDTLIIDYYIKAWDGVQNLTQSEVRTFYIYHYDLGVEEDGENLLLPKVYALDNVYPNPSKEHVIFRYQSPKTCDVRFDIIDVTGRIVKQYAMGEQEPGYYEFRWDEMKTPGVYFYRLTAGDYEATRKIVILE